MVDFKFTKPNGLSVIGVNIKLPLFQAKTYQSLGLGIIIKEVKEKQKKIKKK